MYPSMASVFGISLLNCQWFLTVTVLVKVSITVMKHHDKEASWGKKGFGQLILPQHYSSLKEVRTVIQIGWKPGGGSLHNLLCFRAQKHQPTMIWALPIDH